MPTGEFHELRLHRGAGAAAQDRPRFSRRARPDEARARIHGGAAALTRAISGSAWRSSVGSGWRSQRASAAPASRWSSSASSSRSSVARSPPCRFCRRCSPASRFSSSATKRSSASGCRICASGRAIATLAITEERGTEEPGRHRVHGDARGLRLGAAWPQAVRSGRRCRGLARGRRPHRRGAGPGFVLRAAHGGRRFDRRAALDGCAAPAAARRIRGNPTAGCVAARRATPTPGRSSSACSTAGA